MAQKLVQTQEFLCFVVFFFDHGTIYSAPGMMAADGSSLSLRGKRILAEELAGLIEESLTL